jgi:hypothetical protein
MAFWDDVGKNVGNFFGGLVGQKKKQDDQTSQRNVGTVSAPKAPTNPSQPQIKTQQPKNAFQTGLTDLRLPSSVPKNTVAVKPQKSPKELELDQLVAQNLPSAKKNVSKGRGFVGDALNFFTHNDDKTAETDARNKAVSQYRERHSFDDTSDPVITKYIGNTVNMGNKNSANIKTQTDTLNNVIKKTSEIPVLSDFTAMGSGGAQAFYDAIGDKKSAVDAHNNASQAVLGMTDKEIAQLPPDQQQRLRNLQTGLTVASPVMGALDIGSLGGVGAAVGGLKTAAVQGGKQSVLNAVKQGAKTVGKNALIAAGAAPVIGAPIENYVNNGNPLDFNNFDATSVPRQSLTAALWSVLLPGAAKKQEAEDIINAKGVVKNEVAAEAARTAREAVAESGNKIKVQQPREIPVTDGSPEGVTIPVNTPEPQTGKPIVEVRGDTPGINQVNVPTADEAAAQRFANQPTARPDNNIEGVTTDRSKIITAKDKADAQAVIDDNLKTQKITEDQYRELSAELSKIQAQDEPVVNGQKVNVREVNSIPVTDQSTVAAGLPETPGTVRATTTTDPNATRTAQVAAQTPPSLPTEVQAVLDNPKQFNKRQVASARNQAKLAKAYAKTQEQTADAMSRIDVARPEPTSNEGFVPTGVVSKGEKGNIRENMSINAEKTQAQQETANMSPSAVLQDANENKRVNNAYTARDFRNIQALFDTKRVTRDMPEYNSLKTALKDIGSQAGQFLREQGQAIRRTASADEIISRFESRLYGLVDDPTKIDSKVFDQVDAATNKFTDTRDAALQAYNRFTEEPTPANAKVYHAAQDAADAADKEAKMVEFKVASKTLKGNKDVKQARELEKMAQSADMYQMDAVDASMLSGTGTFVRNAVNAAVGGVEESLFGKVGAKLASLTPKSRKNDIQVGGGIGRDTLSGFGEGAKNIVDASKARASEAGMNPLEHIKNWSTTGNQLGDTIIDSQVKHNLVDHYTEILKAEGYKGRELTDRAGVMARQDPGAGNVKAGELTQSYQTAARVGAGLGSGITRNNKVETLMKNIISDSISGGNPNKYTEGAAKLVTRMVLGFPTAIGRSLAEGAKRFTLGAPTFIKALATPDPQARAILVKEGIKQLGTGAVVIPSAFYALGASGAVTGAYPKGNPEEQARWQREGITENSVKIGDSYYQLPAYLGSWALPGLFYASLGRNGGDFAAAAKDVAGIIPSLLPTDQMGNWQDLVSGRVDPSKFFSQTAASAVRAATPAGALLNQLAKSFDPTQNDTNSGDAMQNFIDKVVNGIPGAANTLSTPKVDDTGNTLVNPNPLALAFGASSTEQGKGVEHTSELNTQTNNTVKAMTDAGAFNDPNLKSVLTDDKTKLIYQNILDGKQVSPDEVKKVQDAMVKGVSTTGDDTAYLEKEQYATNLTALNLKRNLMAADPTTKPSDLKKMDVAIKRGTVYGDKQIPYDLIQSYETVGVDDWRNMGDSEDDAYDPEMYQKLWDIDQAMTQAGVSYKKGALDKQKYSEKKAGSGKGRGSGFSADFGTLKAGTGAPTVQQYASMDSRSGGIPVIQTVRPNIVHKIGFSG